MIHKTHVTEAGRRLKTDDFDEHSDTIFLSNNVGPCFAIPLSLDMS